MPFFPYLAWLWRAPVIWLLLQGIAFWMYIRYEPRAHTAFQRAIIELQAAFHGLMRWVTRPWWAIRRLEELERQNAELLTTLAELQGASTYSTYPVGACADFAFLKDYRFLPARVVYQTFHTHQNYAILNRGSRDGVYPGLGVVGPEGVLGLIAETTATYSIMYAIFHRSVYLNVILPLHGVNGLMTWRTPVLNRVEVDYIPPYVQVKEGEEVWTASNGLIFPGGLRLGRIEAIENDPRQGFQRLRIATYTDWHRLGTVYILLPARGLGLGGAPL
ncbi:MAG: rod shape-determining protein MreC [Bacteroidia bacterium]